MPDAPIKKTRKVPPDADRFDKLAGHYVRRLHQIAVALFMEETEAFRITTVQWAALRAVLDQPEMDQQTLARRIAFDPSTIGGVIDRLEKRGLIERKPSAGDRRVRLLVVTKKGAKLLEEIAPLAIRVHELIIAPLPKKDRAVFVKMMRDLVKGHNDINRLSGKTSV